MAADRQIRAATVAEREWAAKLMASSEPWLTLRRDLVACREACLLPDVDLYVVESGASLCGFIRVQKRGLAGSPYIATLAVAPGTRSKGVGSRLLQFAEGLFRGTHRHLFLCVSSFNTRARALYERRGYRVVGELPDYVIDGSSELLMVKRLSSTR